MSNFDFEWYVYHLFSSANSYALYYWKRFYFSINSIENGYVLQIFFHLHGLSILFMHE